MKILIACEFSGIVRDAFLALGHDAISCDLLPTEQPGPHLQCEYRTVDLTGFDAAVSFPPCTHLATSGARWFPLKRREQQEAIAFFLWFTALPVKRIAIENPVGIMSSLYRKPDQIIQPWQFGHGETKATCLWLKNLPLLRPTNIVEGREPRIHHMPPGPDQGKERSKTYQGIAEAMAAQWGHVNSPIQLEWEVSHAC